VGRVVLLLPVSPARVDNDLKASVDRIVADENVAVEKPKRPRKKRQAITDASELLASSMLNVEAGVRTMATLPLVTSLVSVTPEHESGVPTDSIAGLNLRTIGTSERFVISSDYSHHSSTNSSRVEADSVIRSAIVPPVMTEAMITSYAVNAPSIPVSESGTKI
ncbi:hypothetical protein Tco_0931444, partial [Tanacetum coccineum]